MEQFEEVISWLEAGEQADYQAGVLLLQKHCKNRGLVTNLLKKESAGNREKLVYELVKVGCGGRMQDVSEVLNHFAQAVKGAVQQVATVLVEAHTQVPSFPTQPEPEQVPDEVRGQVDELTQLMGRLHKERCQLSNSLADLNPADAPPVVAKILSLQDQYNALAQKRRTLVEGSQPAPRPEADPAAGESAAPEATIDRAALLQQRGNLRSNISKTRGKLDKAQTEEKRSELSQKLAKLEVELTDVEGKLKQPQA